MKSEKLSARIGTATLDEGRLNRKLAALKQSIVDWANGYELWEDAHFHVPFIHTDAAPERHIVLLLTLDGPLYDVFNSTHEATDRLEEEFSALLEERGFWYELQNHYTVNIMPRDDKQSDEYLALQRWQADSSALTSDSHTCKEFPRRSRRSRDLGQREGSHLHTFQAGWCRGARLGS